MDWLVMDYSRLNVFDTERGKYPFDDRELIEL